MFKDVFKGIFRVLLVVIVLSAYGGYKVSEIGFAANCRDNGLVKLGVVVYTCVLNPEYRH